MIELSCQISVDSGGKRYGRERGRGSFGCRETILRVDLFRVATSTAFPAGVKEAQRQGPMKEKKKTGYIMEEFA
jgi:hypothetical protein